MRNGPRSSAFVLLALLGALALGWPQPAWAAPKPLAPSAKEGVKLARSGDCVAAVPLLEKAETEDHRPVTAAALAGCQLSLGELVLAHEMFDALSRESASPAWSKEDKAAFEQAKLKVDELEPRIPRVILSVKPAAAVIEVRAGGRKANEPREPIRVPPDEKIDIKITAEGFEPWTLSVVLAEGESKNVAVELVPLPGARLPDVAPKPPPPAPRSTIPPHWLGVRMRGLLLPQFVMNIVGEGGTTAYFPGVGVTYTERLETVDIEPSITFTHYGVGLTPFKPNDTPDTEWELFESTLWGMTAALDILYRVPFDDAGRVEMRIGGGVGLGWAFTGELFRWQSYPADGQPGDPATYEKCSGPNDPAGTFRYCNQLDKDAERFGQPDKSWHDGGGRPIVYPWLSLPQIAFAFRPADEVAIDLELGLTLNGLLAGTGVRFGF